MPHLIIQYSQNLETENDITTFCAHMRDAILALGHYPEAGIRVRASAVAHYAIADLDPKNAFLDMTFRIGSGRSDAQKSETGTALLTAADGFFAARLSTGYFTTSLNITEMPKDLSWKTNPIHARLLSERT